ncbi:decorin-like [Rhinoraja longicauda]
MKVAVQAIVSCLLAFLLCHAKPPRLFGRHEPSEEGLGSGAGWGPDWTPVHRHACPPRCRCHVTVVQCSNLGLAKVPPYIPRDTTILDLQNNKIRELMERDFRNLKALRILILVNNRLRRVHSRALAPLPNLRRLYLSRNLISQVPDNMPNSLVELHICDNKIRSLTKKPFGKMANMIALELSRNPLLPNGIARGAFEGLKSLYYLRITETGLTEIPKDLPSSISEIHLDRNRILRVDADDFKDLHSLIRLRLSSNKIRHFANGTIGHMPNLQDLHLDNNRLTAVPPGLSRHKNIMALYLNDNHVAHIRSGDFCPQFDDPTKTPYGRISLYGNPIPYWEIQPGVFRCALDWIFIQLERPN